MKSRLETYARSIGVLFALTLLFSLLFSTLYYFHWISTSTFHITNWISGLIAYGMGGAILGMGIQKKALFHALPVAIIFFLLSLILSGTALLVLCENLSKTLLYIVAAFVMAARSHTV